MCGLVDSRITWPAGKECVQCQACAKPNAACPQQMPTKSKKALSPVLCASNNQSTHPITPLGALSYSYLAPMQF